MHSPHSPVVERIEECRSRNGNLSLPESDSHVGYNNGITNNGDTLSESNLVDNNLIFNNCFEQLDISIFVDQFDSSLKNIINNYN